MLILFDVDGTLCESGKKITQDMYNILKSIKTKYNCVYGIVDGGTINKILYQMDEYKFLFDYIFSECGAMVYKNIINNFECIIEKNMMNIINVDENLKKRTR